MKKYIKYLSIIALVVSVLGVFDWRRRKKSKEKQAKVDGSYKESSDKSDITSDKDIICDVEIIKSFPSDSLCKVELKRKDRREWNDNIQRFISESAQQGIIASDFKGLLKADVPISQLVKVKDNNILCRGFLREDGHISKHAKFKEVSGELLTKAVAFRLLSIVTSQHYLTEISGKLDVIKNRLDTIIDMQLADDKAELIADCKRLYELSSKHTYTENDKIEASIISNSIEKVRSKYRILLSKITDLNIDYSWFNKREADNKKQKLDASNYKEYMEIACDAEGLAYIAAMVYAKIANDLNDEEDRDMALKRMDSNIWEPYKEQFNRIKHDVISFLNISKDESIFASKDIESISNDSLKMFDDIEERFKHTQKIIDDNTAIYIQIGKKGADIYLANKDNKKH